MSAIDKLKLDHPFSVDGKTLTEVSIRRPKVRDIRAVDKVKEDGDLQQGIVTVALLTGLSVEALDDMDAGDFARVSEVVGGFFGNSRAPRTGAP
jgi:hypothetical protein